MGDINSKDLYDIWKIASDRAVAIRHMANFQKSQSIILGELAAKQWDHKKTQKKQTLPVTWMWWAAHWLMDGTYMGGKRSGDEIFDKVVSMSRAYRYVPGIKENIDKWSANESPEAVAFYQYGAGADTTYQPWNYTNIGGDHIDYMPYEALNTLATAAEQGLPTLWNNYKNAESAEQGQVNITQTRVNVSLKNEQAQTEQSLQNSKNIRTIAFVVAALAGVFIILKVTKIL